MEDAKGLVLDLFKGLLERGGLSGLFVQKEVYIWGL